MCNAYRLDLPADLMRMEFSQLKIPFRLPDPVQNFEPRDVRIRELAPVIQPEPDGGARLGDMIWAWPGPSGKPVFNFRSDGRDFSRAERSLIPAAAFYEYTAPADPKAKRKDRWAFTVQGRAWFAIAGVVREGCWSMLTTEPGPLLRNYHGRQVVILPPELWGAWLSAGLHGDALAEATAKAPLQVARA